MLIIIPIKYDVRLHIIDITSDFFNETFKIPRMIKVSINTAVISEAKIYQSFDFMNRGKINQKYGSVAIEAINPVKIIRFSGIFSFLYTVLDSMIKTINSKAIV